MSEKFRIFLLLLRKNFLIRKRRWIQLLLLQIIVPIGMVLMSQSIATGSSSVHIESFPNDTYYRVESEEWLMNFVPQDLVLKYTPSNTITDKIMEDTENCLRQPVNISASPDENTIVKDFLHESKENPWMNNYIGIVFQSIPNNTTLPKLFKYKLRIAASEPTELFAPNENHWTKYTFGQVPTVQVPLCLDKAYINQVVLNPKYKTNISIQQRPYPPYEQVKDFPTNIVTPFSIVSTMIFPIILCVEAALPADEKFIGINVLMAVNGISNRMNLFSWFVSGAILSTTYLLPIVVILKYYEVPFVPPFLIYGDAFLVWLSLFIHTCHLLAFGLHLSAYFWKPFRGIIGTTIMICITNTLSSTLTGRTAQHLFMYLGLLSPNFILRRMISEISMDENSTKGLSWSNLFASTSDTISEGSVGVMMVFSVIGILLNFYMATYIYAIRPGKYGVPRHPLFCIWGKRNDDEDNEKHLPNVESKGLSPKEFEYIEPGRLEPGIQIRGLKKVYITDLFRQTKLDVLRNVSIDIYKRQITALLGHNGAGKTTMMSILSGLTDATEGAVFIDGKNILDETNTINNNISLCPQENILFPELTVHQQLMFFGMMKANNRTRLHLENEVRMLLNKVNLAEKRDNYPAQLSGGQKRRLCLALAIIGDAKVLILDEPTSGMDAESKREVWNILLKMRGEKTILISTHDMEEADILGDRIAIMHTGKLRSYGTSMFLKKLYGDGQIEVTLSVEPWCQISKISKEIGVIAQILSQDDGKIVLALPPAESLPLALDKLENSKKQLGITGISVSIITLEQVFIRVTKDENDEQNSHEDIEVFEKVTGYMYYFQTLSAFLIKKMKYARRNPWSFLIGVFLLCISTLPIRLLSDSVQQNPYPLSLSVYPDTKAFVHSDKAPWSAMYMKTIKDFGSIATEVNSNTSITDVLLNYAKHDKASYQNEVIVSAEFNNTPSGNVLANGFYSGTAILGMPITINCITNTIVKALSNDTEYKIDMSAQRVPYGQELRKEQAMVNSILVTIPMVLLLAQVVALYVNQPLNEILSGIKQLQMMTGAPKLTYWAANFLFDYAQYIISILLMVIVLIIIDVSSDIQLYHGTEIWITLMLLLLFGLSVLPFIYIFTFMKRTINITTIILTLVPIILVVIDFILQFMVSVTDKEAYRIFRMIQSKIFLFVPHVSFAYGHYVFLMIAATNAHCRRRANALPEIYNCTNSISYFTHIEGVDLDLEGSIIWLCLSSIFYFGIIFILEQQYLERLITKIRGNNSSPHSEGLDEIVEEEKKIVANEIAKRINARNSAHHDSGNIFLVQELNKKYGSLHAVKGISFRVKESECFGLLGVNGAGKSTTFKMITGDIMPNGGTIYLKHYNISSDRSNYLSSMGYCPQQDAIITTLNSWDHLYLFARLRGIPSSQVPAIVKQWIKKLNLTPCALQPSGTYSGGNKRRLNIALALIGNPPLVLMDEPTTGVDPAARRSLWNTLKTCQNAGQSIILTSHSMEECEALCSRLVIMVGGKIVCVGASEQLKQRFGAGYNIHIKLSSTQLASDIEAIKQRIISTFNCNLTDQNTGFLGYHVIDPKATWTIMYTLMDNLKNEYNCIEDYVVLSSTLEQLFIQFARSPDNPISNHDNSNGLSSV